MSSYLFLFTIGPVQSYIAQARKTHDLYAGSQLLVDMIGEAKRALNSIFKSTEFIFPTEGSGLNRFLAKVEIVNIDFQHTGKAVENAAMNFLRLQALEAYKCIDNTAICVPNYWLQQLNSQFEIYWAFSEYDENTNYKEKYIALESTIGAMKNTPLYARTPETGRKCDLDGINNVVVYRKLNNTENTDKLYNNNVSIVDKINNDPKHIAKGEGLGAVAFTKRMYNNSSRFKSTIEVAYSDLIRIISDDDLNKLNTLSNKNLQVLDKDNLNEKFFEKYDIDNLKDINNLKDIKNIVNTVYDSSANSTYSDYYAIIKFDGDDMGKWMSGKKTYTNVVLKEFHMELATCLDTYAKYAKQLVETAGGSSIYAGGDDFLGMVPLHLVLPVLRCLRASFHNLVSEKLNTYKASNIHINFSCGVAITHYKSPLSESLSLAYKMERFAKENENKNTFAIGVYRHSGNFTVSRLPFVIPGYFPLDIVIELVEAISKDFSATLFKNLYQEILVLNKLNYDVMENLYQRAATRAYCGNKDEKAKKVNNMVEKLTLTNKLFQIFDNNVQLYLDFLNICDFIKRQSK